MSWATWSNSEVRQGDSDFLDLNHSIILFLLFLNVASYFDAQIQASKLLQKCGSGLANTPTGEILACNFFCASILQLAQHPQSSILLCSLNTWNTNHVHRDEILGRTPTSPPHTDFRKVKREFIILFFGLLTFCLPEGLLLIPSPLRREKTKLTNTCQAGNSRAVICIFSVENWNLLSNLKFLMAKYQILIKLFSDRTFFSSVLLTIFSSFHLVYLALECL